MQTGPRESALIYAGSYQLFLTRFRTYSPTSPFLTNACSQGALKKRSLGNGLSFENSPINAAFTKHAISLLVAVASAQRKDSVSCLFGDNSFKSIPVDTEIESRPR
jgi:hypothetical protein